MASKTSNDNTQNHDEWNKINDSVKGKRAEALSLSHRDEKLECGTYIHDDCSNTCDLFL